MVRSGRSDSSIDQINDPLLGPIQVSCYCCRARYHFQGSRLVRDWFDLLLRGFRLSLRKLLFHPQNEGSQFRVLRLGNLLLRFFPAEGLRFDLGSQGRLGLSFQSRCEDFNLA